MRGIFPTSKDKKYLFPFWFGYDTKMKAQLLLENIVRIQSKGYHVVCITADNYTDNVKLAEELGCTDDKPYFLNPGPEHKGERIYYFFDGVHLMKLMRSHFIDQGKYYYPVFNPNWHEAWHFYPPCNFGIEFCRLNLYQKFPKICGGEN